MSKSSLLLIFGGIAVYYFLTQKKAIGLLQYFIKSIDGVSFSGITPILNMTIGIQNPSNTSFSISDFAGNLSLDGANIGTVSSFTPTEVPAASEIDYPVQIRLSLTGAVSNLINLLQYKQGDPMTVNFAGVINAGSVAVPVNLPYTIKFS